MIPIKRLDIYQEGNRVIFDAHRDTVTPHRRLVSIPCMSVNEAVQFFSEAYGALQEELTFDVRDDFYNLCDPLNTLSLSNG